MYMYLLDSKYIFKFIFVFQSKKKDYKKFSPTPGIEPGPPGWKPGILAIRPRGIVGKLLRALKSNYSFFHL